jgi:lambda family phage portal protein
MALPLPHFPHFLRSIGQAVTRLGTGGLLTRSAGLEAGAAGRRWRGASEVKDVQAAIRVTRAVAMRRARALTGNNPHAASGVEAWVSAAIGTGIKPQSAHPDPKVREALNTAFERATDEIDAEAQTDFYGQQRVACRQMVTDGEVFGTLSTTEAGRLRTRLIDADQVDTTVTRRLDGGGAIVQGVEFTADGRRTAYHILPVSNPWPFAPALTPRRVGAEDVVHLFNPIAPGQARGLTWFAPVLLRMRDLDEARDAQLMRQKIAALLTGFIISQAGGNFTGFGEGTPSIDGVLEGGLEPGVLKVLAAGQDIRFSEPARIGAESIDFLKVTEHEIAAGLGVPYALMTGDLSDANYSSIRAGLVEFRRRVEALQHAVIVFKFCRPIWRRWVTLEILSGRLPAPGFFKNPEPYLSAKWITPRFDWVDPLKDVSAEIAAIEAGLMSRRQAVAARGLDIEELDREIADDRDRAERLKLAFKAQPPATFIGGNA